MKIEDAIITLTELGFDILIKHDVDELGHIHVIRENKTWVLYSFQDLIDFVDSLGER